MKLPSWRKAVYGAQIVGLAALLVTASGQSSRGPTFVATGTEAMIISDSPTNVESTGDGFELPLASSGPTGSNGSPVGVSATIAPASGDGITPPASAASPSIVVSAKKDPAQVAKGPASVVYNGALAPGWEDLGYSQQRIVGNGPAVIDMGEWDGWLFAHPGVPLNAQAIEFKYKTQRRLGNFLLVSVGSADVQRVNEVIVEAKDLEPNVWKTVVVPMAKMNSKGVFVDRIRIRPSRRVRRPEKITIDQVRLLGIGAGAPDATAVSGSPTPTAPGIPDGASNDTAGSGVMSVNCRSNVRKISPFIYGIGWNGAGYQTDTPWTIGATINRWGGNPTSRYNWQTGTWNTAADYYFRNTAINANLDPVDSVLTLNQQHGMQSALTVPMLDWIAKDNSSYSFPVKTFGAQKSVDPENPDSGNGLAPNGNKITTDPGRTSVASTPQLQAQWVKQIAGRSRMYFLDNEPDLWNSTHRDVHPQPMSYDELLDKSIKYASAIRSADPNALIAGPSPSGWIGYFWSGVDERSGTFSAAAPDRAKHGGKPLLEWYLQQMRAYEKTNNVKLLDVLDVHFYPQGERVFGAKAGTDGPTNARRIREVRGLWDPTYTDDSWIGDKIQLLPRMHKIIDENAPGLKLSVGEWNFGAEEHMSSGIATAEALGQFGVNDVYSAFYWTSPLTNSPAYWAFRGYRNFDGQGGHFLENSIGSARTEDLSMFASVNDANNEMTVMLLNANPEKAGSTKVSLVGCPGIASVQTFSYTGNPGGFSASKETKGSGSAFAMKAAPYSINVIRLKLK